MLSHVLDNRIAPRNRVIPLQINGAIGGDGVEDSCLYTDT